MVTRAGRRLGGVLLAAAAALLGACDVDFAGFFDSGSLEERLASRDEFHFLLTGEDGQPLPLDELPEEYSFLVVSDTHIERGDTHGLEALADAVIPGDKFVVVTGDVTQYGTAEDLKLFTDIAGTLNIPCYPVIGNHDIYFQNWPNWRDLIGSTRYKIDGNNTALFILDTANCSVGASQFAWLERELAAVRSAPGGGEKKIFVFTHTNLFVESLADVAQITDSRERARLASLLNTYDVTAMFMGHVHNRMEHRIKDTVYVTLEDYRGHRTYVRVTVTPAGMSYTVEEL